MNKKCELKAVGLVLRSVIFLQVFEIRFCIFMNCTVIDSKAYCALYFNKIIVISFAMFPDNLHNPGLLEHSQHSDFEDNDSSFGPLT